MQEIKWNRVFRRQMVTQIRPCDQNDPRESLRCTDRNHRQMRLVTDEPSSGDEPLEPSFRDDGCSIVKSSSVGWQQIEVSDGAPRSMMPLNGGSIPDYPVK